MEIVQLEKMLAKLEKYGSVEKKPMSNKPLVSGRIAKQGVKPKVQKLYAPFIKVEDHSRCYKPLVHELKEWPKIYFDGPLGSCPFDSPKIDLDTDHDGRDKSKRKPVHEDKKKKKGFCECCCVHYEDQDLHLHSDRHQSFARDSSNYRSLDELIKKGPSLQDFLEKMLLKHKQKKKENQAKNGATLNECDSPMTKDEPVRSISKTTVSPVAGRTRRRLQQKTEGDKTLFRMEAEDEPPEQVVRELTHKDEHLDEMVTETSTEKQTEPALAGISRDATSSPVPSVMIKFLRPFAAGGSPCRVSLRGKNSQGVSPTTGILKRWNGNKQAVDSPSPPGKVRRVSFALPVKDDDNCEESKDRSSEPTNTVSQLKTSSSSPFTAVKQRRPIPAISDQSTHDLTDCVYPDLVTCTVPVEQILPSILTMSWSRGMGHLVRAQNIHTIGNLSALKEEQVKNLPIKPPKVPTLKKALKRFHQTRGKNSKPFATKLLADASLKEETETKEEVVISTEHAQPQNEVSAEVEPIREEDSLGDKTEAMVSGQKGTESTRDSEVEEINSNEQSKTDNLEISRLAKDEKTASSEELEPTETIRDINAKNTALPAKCDTVEGEPADQMNEGSDGESLTPPFPAHDPNAVEVTADMSTPQREKCSLPTKLFSCEKSENDEMLSLEEVKEDEDKRVVLQGCDEESKQNKRFEPILPVQTTSEHSAETSEAVAAVEEENCSDSEKFCDCLRSLKALASPEVLRNLSSEEIFEAHHNLTEAMSVVVQALKGRWQSPRSHK